MARRLDIVFAAEYLLPPVGGAELWVLELLEWLAARHRCRAVWLDGGEPASWRPEALPPGVEGSRAAAPAPTGGYWADKAARRESLGAAVASELARRRADVLITQLHGAPAALAAAERARVPGVLVLPSFESLCKHAFSATSDCAPEHDCASCPATARLPVGERGAMLASRVAHEHALSAAAELVAPGPALASACEAWAGRRPVVVAPVSPPLSPPRHAEPDGPVVAAAGRWSPNKGRDLLAGICRALAPRKVVVTDEGLAGERDALAALANVRLARAPVRELLAGASVALVPSQWPEPFGRVAFEALAAGVPVVASAVGSLPSFVPAEGLIEPGAPIADWAAVVARLTDPAGFAAVSDRARDAAGVLLRQRPLATLERVLLDASGAVSPAPPPAPPRYPSGTAPA